MVGIAQSHIGVLFISQLIVQDGEADAAPQGADGHVAREKEGGGRQAIPRIIGETASPLLSVQAQQVHALAQAGKARVDIGVGVGEVGEYNCANYTIGGDNTKNPKDKGIDGLISNMSANMSRARLQQLHDDGIVTLDTGFLGRDLPSAYKNAVEEVKDDPTITKFGHLTITQLTAIITKLTETP